MSVWKKCSSCKKEIELRSRYYECSVSTCNGKRTGLVFCSVPCWERHLPGARHRDAAAIEKTAPAVASPEASSGQKRRIVAAAAPPAPVMQGGGNQHEILVVVSKLKAYIKDQADMNTSQDVMEKLSNLLRTSCDGAIENARRDGRKTVMARDF